MKNWNNRKHEEILKLNKERRLKRNVSPIPYYDTSTVTNDEEELSTETSKELKTNYRRFI